MVTFDGTLLNSCGEISPTDMATLMELGSKGISGGSHGAFAYSFSG